ncbi:DNA repair protein RecN [Branchiibius hedensis]
MAGHPARQLTMLRELRIRNLGVIEDAALELSPGLNVLTGETGAGKTMVVQSLGMLLGQRADPALVRAGAERASVEGITELAVDHPAATRALEAGAQIDDGELILQRSVTTGGRSRAIIGGATSPIGVLREVGEHIVAVHGQADQWRLARADQHRAVLDDFGRRHGRTLARALESYRSAYAEWQATRTELAALQTDSQTRTLRLDQLTSALQDIERVDPQPGEDEALVAEASRLDHVELLRETTSQAHRELAGDDDGGEPVPHVLGSLSTAGHALGTAAEYDAGLADLVGRVRELSVLAADVAADLGGYLADLPSDPQRLAWVQQRRSELNHLTRRYGSTVDEVLAFAESAAAEVATLDGGDERLTQLREQLPVLQKAAVQRAGELTAARRAAAKALGKAVNAELGRLAMGSAQLHVDVTPREPVQEQLTADGADEVSIELSSAPGQPSRSVAKAASGGELSRIMLALEVVLGADDVPTFVFDEVDAGVGGAAAHEIGARLADLAHSAQVIVVTHLPQVAAYADHHLVVHKQSDGAVTQSDVTVVDGEQRVAELARMLGGVADSRPAREHARELLSVARER